MSHIGIGLKEIDGAIQDVHLSVDGNLAMVKDAEAVGEHAKQRVMTFKGEWFLNSDVGVPWLTQLLGKGYNPALAESIIKSTIRKTGGVSAITSFSVRFNKVRRQLSAFDITVKTIYDNEVQL